MARTFREESLRLERSVIHTVVIFTTLKWGYFIEKKLQHFNINLCEISGPSTDYARYIFCDWL